MNKRDNSGTPLTVTEQDAHLNSRLLQHQTGLVNVDVPQMAAATGQQAAFAQAAKHAAHDAMLSEPSGALGEALPEIADLGGEAVHALGESIDESKLVSEQRRTGRATAGEPAPAAGKGPPYPPPTVFYVKPLNEQTFLERARIDLARAAAAESVEALIATLGPLVDKLNQWRSLAEWVDMAESPAD